MEMYDIYGNDIEDIYDKKGRIISPGESEKYIDGRLVLFEDDFEGTTLNETNWQAENRNNFGNNSIQAYTSRGTNIRVENSNLVITARREQFWGKSWTSAQIVSRGLREFKYGRIEAKIKVPQTGAGLWPAFWTLGRTWYSSDAYTINWAKCGEIDILEMYDSNGIPTSTIHYDIGRGHESGDGKRGSVLDLSKYHVYSCEWTENRIEIFVDGISIGYWDTTNIAEGDWMPFRNPHYILLCLQVYDGVNENTPTVNEMYVDWVRVLAPAGVLNRVYPSSVALSGIPESMNVGETAKLVATISPTNATEQTVKWRSENELKTQIRGGQITKLQNQPCSVSAVCENGVHADFITPYTSN